MLPETALILAGLILVAAFLYASVGHAGASGYLAAMALFSVPPAVMKPTALVLNILVAGIACWKYISAGRFSSAMFLPLAVASVPCAYLGGYLEISPRLYKPLLGVALDIGLLEGTRVFGATRMIVFGGLVALLLVFMPRGILDETRLRWLAARLSRSRHAEA